MSQLIIIKKKYSDRKSQLLLSIISVRQSPTLVEKFHFPLIILSNSHPQQKQEIQPTFLSIPCSSSYFTSSSGRKYGNKGKTKGWIKCSLGLNIPKPLSYILTYPLFCMYSIPQSIFYNIN